jgi:DnaJ-like protein
MKDYYRILEVEPTATAEQVKAQYLFLTQAWHPEKFPNADLKAKAEEKIKEINEAYGVLGDPSRRESYNSELGFRSSKATSAPPASSHSSQGHPHSRSGQRCESCGLPAETKYVEFHENTGLILIRQYRSVKGNLCKACINYFFWNLTGRTMLFGWWGVISFIVTPFILLNNISRFIFTFGMQKPLVQIVPRPSAFWLLSTIGGLLSLGSFGLFSIAAALLAQPAYTHSPPAESSNLIAMRATPTHIPTRVYTPPLAVDCLLWSEVSPLMIGEMACVYGNVDRTRTVGDTTFQVLFTDDPSAFFLATGSYYYEVGSGDCVAAEGEILRSAVGVPYININDALYECEPWME